MIFAGRHGGGRRRKTRQKSIEAEDRSCAIISTSVELTLEKKERKKIPGEHDDISAKITIEKNICETSMRETNTFAIQQIAKQQVPNTSDKIIFRHIDDRWLIITLLTEEFFQSRTTMNRSIVIMLHKSWRNILRLVLPIPVPGEYILGMCKINLFIFGCTKISVIWINLLTIPKSIKWIRNSINYFYNVPIKSVFHFLILVRSFFRCAFKNQLSFRLGIPQPRAKSDDQSNPNIYEMRSYWLKPGTLIEWGNLWHKGVQYRPDAKVLGVFSQIGDLYNVHHMWSYKNFQQRKKMRTNAWAKPGWSEKYVLLSFHSTQKKTKSVDLLAWNIPFH